MKKRLLIITPHLSTGGAPQVTCNKIQLIKDDFEITDLDLSYGSGFSKFHQELMNRFRRENKGLVLFHGLPGTGK